MAHWMKPSETISGKEGEVYVKVGTKRYNYGHLTEIEATLEVKKSEVPTLGSKMTGHKISGMTGKWKGKIYYVESEIRQAWVDYKNGKSAAPIFEISISNEDTSTSHGRQTVTLYDCMSDSLTLAKLDTGSENLDEDIEGTFDDFEMPEKFAVPDGMEDNNVRFQKIYEEKQGR